MPLAGGLVYNTDNRLCVDGERSRGTEFWEAVNRLTFLIHVMQQILHAHHFLMIRDALSQDLLHNQLEHCLSRQSLKICCHRLSDLNVVVASSIDKSSEIPIHRHGVV